MVFGAAEGDQSSARPKPGPAGKGHEALDDLEPEGIIFQRETDRGRFINCY